MNDKLARQIQLLVHYDDLEAAKKIAELLETDNTKDYTSHQRLMANLLLDYVNCMTDNTQLVEVVLKAHRALQERLFQLMLKLIEAWSKVSVYDKRNK